MATEPAASGAMPPGDPAATARPSGAADRARSVSTELAAIFASAAAANGSPPRRQTARAARAVRILDPQARRPSRAVALGGVFAAGLVGLSAGSLLMQTPELAAPPAPIRSQPPAAIVASLPAAPATAPRKLGELSPAAPSAVRRLHPPRQARAQPSARAAVVRAKRSPRRLRRASRALQAAAAAHEAQRCRWAPRGERAWCAHQSVMAADAQLRRAYARAVRAGVSRPVLISYRGRWTQLRGRALREPYAVAAGYGALAGGLSRQAEQARAHRDSPRRADLRRSWPWL